MLIDSLLVLLGIALLTLGGEALIRGALAAAKQLAISPLLSGLVIVGFGTSAPELVVSVDAAIKSQPDIAIGNVVGSNIGNILLILGICAVITPLKVRPLVLRRDAIVVVASSLLFVLLVSNGSLNTSDAVIFLTFMAAYLLLTVWSERNYNPPSATLHKAEATELSSLPSSPWTTLLAVVAGLALLLIGSKVLLTGAVSLALSLRVSEAVIGLTLVAVGTSLPELFISVMAALRRHADVAVGNVLGSNIFNMLGILGISTLLQPLPAHSRILHFDQWMLLGTSILLLFFLYTGSRLSRLEGATLLFGYGIYLWLSFTIYGG